MQVKKDLGGFLLLAIAAIIGITFLIAVANTTNLQTSTQTSLNETQSIASARLADAVINSSYVFKVNNWYGITNKTGFSGFVLRANTGATITAGNYTFDTTYGNYTLTNTTYLVTLASNTTYRDYTYKDPNYVDDGSSRAVVALIIIFGAIAIFTTTLVYFLGLEGIRNLLRMGGGTRIVNN